MARITNPKKYMSDEALLNLPILRREGSLFRLWLKNESYRTPTGCQCYKDCNCSETAGMWVEKHTEYFRNLEFDGTDKAFHSDINYKPTDYKKHPYEQN